MRGAGGRPGGLGQFFIGFVMMCVGGYLFLNSIQVNTHFGLGRTFLSFGGLQLTGGMVLLPFIFGIGIVFYNSKNPLGWLLVIGALSAFSFGVISSVQFSFRRMSAFELITILVLAVGGLGLFLNSLKNFEASEST